MVSNLLRRRLRELATSERGMALPVALFAMISSMALAGAAVVSSVDVQQGTKRDSGSKSAIAAADGGANLATMRLSRYANSLDSSPCLAESGGTLVTSGPAADGWCPPVVGAIGDATYSYRVSPAGPLGEGLCGEYDLCIVSTGIVDGVSRRIEMSFNESTLGGSENEEEENEEEGTNTGGGFEGLVGEDGIELSGSAEIHVGIGTNGNVVGSGNSHSVCGDIRVGIGKSNSAKQCTTGGFKVTQGNVNLPPVSSFIPANIATVNSNNRLRKCVSTNNPVDCQKDTFTGNWSSTDPFDPAPSARSISLTSKSLTVSGGDYWICSLRMSGNSELIMRAGAKVRFFFDTPENCNLPPGAAQIKLNGTSAIVATGNQPSLGQYDVPGFYLLGSKTRESRVELNGTHGDNEIVLYGPNTKIFLSGSASYEGLIAGKTVSATGSVVVENDSGFELPPELQPPTEEEEEESAEETPGVRYFTPQAYVECSGDAASPPNASC